MKPILVICPSRDRNIALLRAIDSMLETSTETEMVVYVDEDQRERYEATPHRERVHWWFGEQIGPCASYNLMVEKFPGYEVYGAMNDDSEFMTVGWDQWVLKTARAFPGGIGVLSPKLPDSDRMDYPYATSEWIKVLGHFAWPGVKHFYWDVLVELLGEGADCIAYGGEKFMMFHENAATEQVFVKTVTDARNLLPIIATERSKLIQKLKEAIRARSEAVV